MSKTVFLAASALAVAFSGQVLAQVQPMADPAPGGLVDSINLAYLKGVFDRVNVPAQIVTDPNQMPHVASVVGGNQIFVVPQLCANDNANGDCKALSLLSGGWVSRVTLEKVAAYAAHPGVAAILRGDNGEYLMRYTVLIRDGVGPDFVKGTISQFSMEMQNFGKFLAQEEGAAPATGGGFSASAAPGAALSVVKEPGVQQAPVVATGPLQP